LHTLIRRYGVKRSTRGNDFVKKGSTGIERTLGYKYSAEIELPDAQPHLGSSSDAVY